MKTVCLITLGICLAASTSPAQVTSERLVNAAREPQQWMTYSGAYDGSRFSPLDQINRTNVQTARAAVGVSDRHPRKPRDHSRS